MEYEALIKSIVVFLHPEYRKGRLFIGPDVSLSPHCLLDLTGDIHIGEKSMIGRGTRIYTHDHYHEGREPLLDLQKRKGVKWQDKRIGRDVWLHECIVLYQVTDIPDGVVVGAGSVLTRNPEVAYGIYAGNPARLIGERR